MIGVTSCNRSFDGGLYHAVGHNFVAAVKVAAGGMPMVVPSTVETSTDALVCCMDGLLVTGSKSHINPAHYGAATATTDHIHDHDRDATTMPLIRAAISDGIPLLAICRGIQELNVAFGGTLHQQVQEIDGMIDHRKPDTDDPDIRHAPRHGVDLTPDGVLAGLARELCIEPKSLRVNSLHEQAIDRLAPNLVVEAVAEDGTIEAVRVEDAKAFAIGVQWHPEYKSLENPFSAALFKAFGAACRARTAARMALLSAAG